MARISSDMVIFGGVIPVGGWSHGTSENIFIKMGSKHLVQGVNIQQTYLSSIYTNTTDIFVIPNKALFKRFVALGEYT